MNERGAIRRRYVNRILSRRSASRRVQTELDNEPIPISAASFFRSDGRSSPADAQFPERSMGPVKFERKVNHMQSGSGGRNVARSPMVEGRARCQRYRVFYVVRAY